ncbi:MAG TPA: GNAT family protein [Gaiellales bacterium]|nr:GNAT family protein [Gaiellales bacterium]
MILRGSRLLLRPMREEDVPRLSAIAAEPEVARWWGDVPESELRAKAAGEDDAEALAIELDGDVVGLIQVYEHPDPQYRHAGIDLFLSSEVTGRGLGREAVGVLAAHLLDDRGHHRLTIDPAAENERAIRCYEAVGFRRVGIMRRYERGPDGRFHDGLLMELVREDQ